METHKATRISITVERVIQQGVLRIVEAAGARGYSVFHGDGKGRHHTHPVHRPAVAEGFSIVKIEVIVSDRAAADRIAEEIAAAYFEDYPGIVTLEAVEVLRREKF